MKQTKKIISFVLAVAMILSLSYGLPVKAAASVTITLRLEQDEDTLAAPIQITLTDEDTKTGYGLNLATGAAAEVATPLHALAKYMKSKGATDDTMSRYIAADFSYGSAYITGISTQGKCNEGTYGSAASGSQENVYWNYTVNNIAPSDPETKIGYAADQYILKNNDTVVFYGLWSPYPAPDETLFSYFNQASYTTEAGKPISVTLNGNGIEYDEQYNAIPYTKPVSGGYIIAAGYTSDLSCATRKNACLTVLTDADGKASLTFQSPGKYVLSAYRQSADKNHFDISRPYALVTVTEKTPAQSTAKTTSAATVSNSRTSKKPAKVTKVKATVSKSVRNLKPVALTWKKISGVTGYKVYVSKKKSKGYEKMAKVTKRKTTLKLAKGTYYIKVRAYVISGKTKVHGKYSTPLKVKVKKK